ncbi:transferase family-domain-containing protein [Chaetomidium leptoderma]|uniref:Transferase family-domain-containing protein n=1 Tax=Chaetomidium leptoderma TaxID=669021 RepID=A0AAN6ZTR0_9PEZI|nr:transferase family-domain-containing protein [Chaetomidium leptoderma]
MDPNDCLDILGQQPFLNIYTQLSLIFPVTSPSSHADIIDTLTAGLERLAENLPWVAGQVTIGDPGDGAPGSFRIVPLGGIPSLAIRDLRRDSSAPTMDSLRRAGFPFRMLDEALVAPQPTLPGGVAGSGPEPTPVFAVQVNFIAGGLILTCVAQHQTMDLTGQCQVMSLLSRICRGENLTSSEIADANPTRRGRIPLLGDTYTPGHGLDFQVAKPLASPPASDESPATAAWAYFAFSPESLAAIKLLAMENAATPPGFVSTDDALTAFIWQSVARVRGQRLRFDAKSTLGRAVDVRRHLGVPQTYPGMLQNLAYKTHTLQELARMPLGNVASELRLAVDPSTSQLAYTTRALATMIERVEDKSTVSLTAGIDPSTDLLLSSWTNPGFYNMDFGLGLGKPEAVRRPCFVPVEGLGYFMPRLGRGQIVVAICLRAKDLQGLQDDTEFSRYTTYIG